MLDLLEGNVKLGSLLLGYPIKLIPLLDQAIIQVQNKLISNNDSKDLMTFKQNVRARISNLPLCPELTRSKIPKNEDNFRLISISGSYIKYKNFIYLFD